MRVIRSIHYLILALAIYISITATPSCNPDGELTGLASIESALQIPSTCGRSNSVTTAGNGFRCNKQDFTFVGVNARELIYAWNLGFNAPFNPSRDPVRAARIVYDQLYQAGQMGASVIRVHLPRQEHAFNGDLVAFHKYFADQLRYLLDFATEQGPFNDEGINDYRKFRVDANGASLPPPAPNMKFLVVLQDYIYACDRDPWGNQILITDLDAYTDPTTHCAVDAPNLHYLRPEWFQRTGTAPNYTNNYLPFVRSIASAFFGEPRIFGFEVGNEMKAGSASDMQTFLNDTVCAIKGIGCRRGERNLSAGDRNRLVGTGFISSWHAAGGQSSAADAARDLYKHTNVDFGSIHQYNDLDAEQQLQDVAFFSDKSNHVPYIVGELGYDSGDRPARVTAALSRLFDTGGADGVLQWAFYGSRDLLILDNARHPAGLDIVKVDWADVFAVYACRAAYLNNQNGGRLRDNLIDVALVELDWTDLSQTTQAVRVGDLVQFHAHVCNAGSTNATQGIGVSFYLDNSGVSSQARTGLGNAFLPGDLPPLELTTVSLDWTAVDPSTLHPGITLQNAILVGLADDINRYPSEITEENNGSAVKFPMLGFLQRQTAWQMHVGEGLVPFSSQAPRHGDISEYGFSNIPAGDDPGWVAAPDGSTIGFSEPSTLCGNLDCRAGGQFTYFQTLLSVPTTFTTVSASFGSIDDGVRIVIFNSDNPNGTSGSYAFLGGSVTIDLSGLVKPSEVNRVVVTHVDDCCSGSFVSGAVLTLDGAIILPMPQQ